jgi:hypothetical protein
MELERLHNQWFNAFDKGDGAAMDKMEIPNLILINADGKGGIWEKHGPRAGKQKPTGNSTRLSNLQVRQFGNSAILTGVVTIKDGQESARSSTTVVWVNFHDWQDSRPNQAMPPVAAGSVRAVPGSQRPAGLVGLAARQYSTQTPWPRSAPGPVAGPGCVPPRVAACLRVQLLPL